MGTHSGRQLCDFAPLLVRGQLKEERVCASMSKFFPLKVHVHAVILVERLRPPERQTGRFKGSQKEIINQTD